MKACHIMTLYQMDNAGMAVLVWCEEHNLFKMTLINRMTNEQLGTVLCEEQAEWLFECTSTYLMTNGFVVVLNGESPDEHEGHSVAVLFQDGPARIGTTEDLAKVNQQVRKHRNARFN